MIMGARVFTVVAAVMGVATVALAALLPYGYVLADALVMAQPDAIKWLQEHTTPWLWSFIETPLLVRPAWLIPAGFALVAGGIATSLSLRASPSQRRS